MNSGISWTTGTASGNTYNVESVILHELGHVGGLQDLYGDLPISLGLSGYPSDTNKVMFGVVDDFYGNMNQKTLSSDDVAGMKWIYPSGSVSSLASFTTNVTSGTAPLAVTFTDTSSNTPNAWNWSFRNVTPGNNTQVWFSTVQNPTHTYGVGNYAIVLNASNSTGYNISTQVTFINVTTTPVNLTDKIGIYRNGVFYLRNSNSNGIADNTFGYGNLAGDTPVVGDWNADGTDTIGIYRNGVFYLRNSNSNGFADITFGYGNLAGDIPVVGDWNGDGTDTIGIYRNGVFYLRNSNTNGIADLAFTYGQPGDVPVVGDWNGIGTDTIGIYRNGVFYLRNSNTNGIADNTFGYGNLAGDTPVVGDWNADGTDTIGIYRNGVFYLRNSNTNGIADLAFTYGQPGDVPVVGDWNGT